MKAVILAGGFGTRLRPLTSTVPKSMVLVANRPIMEHIIMLLKRNGFRDIVAILFHEAEKIKNYFGDGSSLGVSIEYVIADKDFGTAGCVKIASSILTDRFLVMSSDSLTDFNLQSIVAFHEEKNAKATIMLSRVKNPLDYGIVHTSRDGCIERILEKPGWGSVFTDTVNAGTYVLEPEILQYIPEEQEWLFARDLFPELLKKKIPIYGYITEHYWKDIGDFNEYRAGHADILEDKLRMELRGKRIRINNGSLVLGDNTKLDDDINIEGMNLIGNNVEIAKGATLVNSVIGDNCKIKCMSTLQSTIVWNDAEIGEKCYIKDSILGSSCKIGDRALILENVVVGSGVKIGKGSSVRANVKIWPDKKIEDGALLTTSFIWGDTWQRELFVNSRITGRINMEITPEFAARLGAAYGSFLGKGRWIQVSRDYHGASRMIELAFMSGVYSTGINIKDLGTLPIPLIRYNLKQSNDAGGIYLRVSPFNHDMLDILFFDQKGGDLHHQYTRNIQRLFFREDFVRKSNIETGHTISHAEALDSYKKAFLEMVDRELLINAGFSLVIDFAGSSASDFYPLLLESIACEVVSLNPHHDPAKLSKTEDEFNEAKTRVSRVVKSINADLGAIIDAGAEKMYLINENGEMIDFDMALVLIATLFAKAGEINQIAVPVSASHMLEKILEQKNISVLRTKETAAALLRLAYDNNIQMLADRKGGYIFPKFHPFFDAIYTMVKVLESFSKVGMRLGELQKELNPIYLMRRHIYCPWEKKGLIMRKIMEYTSGMSRELVDGVKVNIGPAWVIIRPDENRPICHVDAEAETEEKALVLINEYNELIDRWVGPGVEAIEY